MIYTNELKLAIYESSIDDHDKNNLLTIVENTTDENLLYDVYEILESVMGDDVNMYVTESFFASPVRKYINELEEIKNTKPKEYDGPEDVKKFADKYYDKIVKLSKHLEEEPEKLRKDEIAEILTFITGIVGSEVLFVICPIAGLGLMTLTVIASMIACVIKYIRINDDSKAFNNLVKIRSSLKKVRDKKGLPEKVKNKIQDMITAIDDAEDEISTRVKTTVKESVLEAYKAGVLTESEVLEVLEASNMHSSRITDAYNEPDKSFKKDAKEILAKYGHRY